MKPSSFDRLTRLLAFRSSRRAALAGVGLAAATTLGANTLTTAEEDSPVASPTASTGRGTAHPDATFLFVQTAASATWAPKPDTPGTFVLTMPHHGQTVYFSDRPERITGSGPTANLLKTIGFFEDPPNAAIVAGEHIITVELTNPVYDEATGTLSYDATPLDPSQASEGLAHLAGRHSGTELPETLGPVSLFIDSVEGSSCSQYDTCWDQVDCATFLNVGPLTLGVVDACLSWSISCEPCDDDTLSVDILSQSCANSYPDACARGYGCTAGNTSGSLNAGCH